MKGELQYDLDTMVKIESQDPELAAAIKNEDVNVLAKLLQERVSY